MRKVLIVSTILVLLLLSGCTFEPRAPVNDSNFINYGKPRVNYTQPDIVDNKTIEVVHNGSDIVGDQLINEGDYLIGAFNVQIFGKTKASNEPVYETIIEIIDDYDVIAIQEIRDISGTVTNKLNQVPNMKLRVSERLGRSSSKEQYAFLYSSRVTPGRAMQYPDVDDDFERPPYMMEFVMDSHEFVIIQVHVKPTDAENEIRALPEVVEWAKVRYGPTKDMYIMGDLNADCAYFDSFYVMSDYYWLIQSQEDTTVGRSDCAYDRIIAMQSNPNILDVGVDNLYAETGEDRELLEAVSDHYPIYFVLDKAEI